MPYCFPRMPFLNVCIGMAISFIPIFPMRISILIESQFYLWPIPTLKKKNLELYQQKLERDLIDFNLRDIVTKETQNVRDLLIAKAFSNGEFDEEPRGEVSDPVGFDPIL
jgi:His-Xaa-Ser system protein HxsD